MHFILFKFDTLLLVLLRRTRLLNQESKAKKAPLKNNHSLGLSFFILSCSLQESVYCLSLLVVVFSGLSVFSLNSKELLVYSTECVCGYVLKHTNTYCLKRGIQRREGS